MMKNLIRIVSLTILLAFGLSASYAQTIGDYHSAASGNWTDFNTWEYYNGTSWVAAIDYPGQSGTAGVVTIQAGSTVAGDAGSAICSGVVIQGTLNISGSNSLEVQGSWTNNGTFAAGTGTVAFSGAGSVTVSGSATTAFFNLTINKTNGITDVIDVSSSGTISCNHTLTLTNGLLKLTSGTVNFNCNSGFTINQQAGIQIDGATLTSGDFFIVNNGLFRMTTGIAFLGQETGNSLQTATNGSFIMEGGTLNIAGRLVNTAGSANISGGTINLSTIGHTNVSYASFDMSATTNLSITGGTIILVQPNTSGYDDIQIVNSTVTKSISGGTFQIGGTSTPAGSIFRISSAIPFYNLLINNTNSPSVQVNGNDLTISNTLTMRGGDIDGATNNKKLILTKPNINALDNSAGYINGKFERAIGTGSAYLFPLVNSVGSTPVILNFSGQNSGGTITVTSVSGTQPNLGSSLLNPAQTINSYWTIVNSGVTFTDMGGVFTVPATFPNISSYKVGVYNGSSWSYPAISGSNATSITFSGITSLPSTVSFAIADCVTPPAITGTLALCANGTSQLANTDPPAITDPWVSDNTVVATVNNTGLVNGVSAGTSVITFTNAAGCLQTAIVAVNPNHTINLTSVIETTTQAICISTPLTNITYSLGGGATGATVSGLPTGVNGSISGTTYTISGTPTVSGSFGYTVTTTGNSCVVATATGTITVNPENTITRSSASGTDAQTTCINTAITNITYTTTGATGAAFSGLPSGVNGSWAANVVTISGTPTVSGNFNYSISLTGGCGNITATGTITVTTPITASATITDPILCFGSTANVKISASGGTPPYTFNFQGKTSNSNGIFTGVTGSVGGTDYSWSVTDALNCAAATGTLNVKQPVELTATAAVSSPILCNGSSGTVTISASGGTTPLSYTLNGITNSSGVFTGMIAGTYNWSVKDANNCTPVAGTVPVTEPTVVAVTSATITSSILCNGGTGTVTITATGGTGTLHYTFNGQTNTAGVFSNVHAGTGLSYSVTDDNGCGPVFGSLNVTQPAVVAASAAVTSAILCNGGTATVTLTASGGNAPYSYTFNGVTQPADVFTGITAGSNIVWSVTDANSCTAATGTLSVTQPNALTASVSENTSITCFGGSAEIKITASGGTGAKTYVFNGVSNATGIFTGVTAQNNVAWSVTDANACSVSGTYNVVQPAQIVVNTISSNSPVCQGSTLNLTSSASGGTGALRYNWTGPNGFTANNSQNPTISNATPAASGTYTLTVTDANNCTKTATTDVIVNPTATMTDPADQVVCDNTSTTAVNFTGADSYNWTNNNTSIGLAANGIGNIPSFTATNTTNAPVTATITVTPTSNACPGIPQTFTITVNPIPVATATPMSSVYCRNSTTNIVLSSNVAGTTFTWTAAEVSGSVGGFSDGSGSAIIQDLTNEGNNNNGGIVEYTITPTANGCVGSPIVAQVELVRRNIDEVLTVTGTSSDITVCPGEPVGYNLASQNGGNYWIRFSWQNDNPNVGLVATGGPLNNDNRDNRTVYGSISFIAINSTNVPQTANIVIIASAYRDNNNNFLCDVVSETRTITVDPFTMVCPADYDVAADAGSCQIANLSVDNPVFACPPTKVTWQMSGATVASSASTGKNYIGNHTFNVGTTTIDYSAEDAVGNSASCTFTVTVSDDEPPTISNCPSNINKPMDAGKCGAVVTWTTPTATDNCTGSVTLTRTDGTGYNSGDVFPVGTTTISYLATDAAGNTSTCSFNVTVAPDAEAPVITCVGDQTVCAAAGNKYTNTGTGWDATATDNCSGTITKTYSLSGATTGTGTSLNNIEFNVGTTTVTWTAKDVNNNSSSCSFDVFVNEMPTAAIAGGNQAVCLNGSITFTATATGTPAPTYQWRKNGTAISGQTGSTLTINPVQSTDAANYDVGVTNSCGSATSSPVSLAVSSAPAITVQPANQTDCLGESVVLNVAVSGGNAPYSYAWEMRLTSGDAWGSTGTNNDNLLVSNIGDPANPNGAEYRVTVTDACGNSDVSSIATLTVNQIVTQALVNTTVCQGGNTTFTVSTSGSTPVSYEWRLNGTPVSNGGPYSGATSPTLTITNAQVSEGGTYSVNVTFNITQPNNNGAGVTSCAMSADIGLLTVDLGPDIVATSPSQTICPGSAITDIVLSNANGTPGTTYSWTRDNTTVLTGIPASGNGSTISGTLNSASPGTTQTTTFTITATANGCVSTGQATVTVVDDQPPVVTAGTCPADISVGADGGSCGAVVNYTPPTFDDNCDGNGLAGTLVAGLAPGATFPIGKTTVTWQYTDAVGNTPATCSFDVTVSDNIAPTMLCKNMTVQLDASGNATITTADIDNGSTDNCGSPTLSLDKTSFNCSNLGANTVTLTGTDGVGNTASCQATVTVEDHINPEANCKNITVFLDNTGNASITSADIDNGSSDNCGIPALSIDKASFNCTNLGVNTVILTASDASGNINTCAAIVTVQDNTNPVAVCKDITVQLDATGNATITATDIDNGSSDNCGTPTLSIDNSAFNCSNLGANTVTLTASDASGNVNTCQSTVTVQDNIDPVAICKDITVELDASGNATITPADVDGGSTDNCSSPALSLDKTTFDCTNLGANTVTLTAKDGAGNSTTCNAVVTIADNNYPVAISASVSQSVIDCYGGTATVTISKTGGVGTLTYTFNGVSNGTGVFNNVSAATGYAWSVANALGCGTASGTFDVIQPNELSATIASSDVTCSSGNDGSITISAPAGGSGNYEYTINGGADWQSSSSFSNLAPGFYDVRIRDANATGCVITLNSSVQVYQLSADFSHTDVTCNGATDGTITISNAHGGSNTFDYSKDGGASWQASGNFSGLAPGFYNVQIRDANEPSCFLILDGALEITEPGVLSATLVSANITCNGASDGTITVSAPTGGYGTYEVSINGTNWFDLSGATPYQFANLSPGNYIVQIRDKAFNTCLISLPAQTITEPAVLSALVASTDVTCNGLNNGSITISSAAGGSGSHEYSIDGGASWQASGSYTNLAPATYNVQIRDASATACIITLNASLVIAEPPAMVIATQPVDAENCKDGTVSFSVTATGGVGTVNYSWQRKRPSDAAFTNIAGATTATLTVATIGDANSPDGTHYRVTVSDNCTNLTSNEVILTVNQITAVTPASTNSSICEGDNFSYTLTTSGGAPISYQWQVNTSGTWSDVTDNAIISGSTTSQLTFTGATPAENGKYRVVVSFPTSDGLGCNIDSGIFDRNLTVKPKPTVDLLPATLTYCQGETTPVISLTGSPSGVVFDITGGTSIGLYDQTGVTQIPSYTALKGTATITITPRANGCTGTPAMISVVVNPLPGVSVTPLTQTICSGSTTSVLVSSSLVGSTFSWTTTVTPAGSITGATDETDEVITKLEQTLTNTTTSQATVVYTITAKKDACSGPPINVTIKVQPRIDLIITDPPDVCSPGTVDLTAASVTAGSTAGLVYTYWADAATTTALSTPTAVGAGTYYIKGTNTTTNCYVIQPVTVTVNPSPTVVVNTPAPVCAPGTVDLTAPAITMGSTSGLIYSYWEDAAATIALATPTAASDGTYYIKGVTADGCSDIKPVTVTVYTDVQTPVFADGLTSSVCQGSAPHIYTATAINATGISYSLDAASLAAGNTINSSTGQVTFAPGFYGTITVTATATGCTAPTTAIHTITVHQPPTVTLAPLTTTICRGQSVTLTATSSGSSVNETYSGSTSTSVNIPDDSNNAYAYSTVNLSGSGGATLTPTDVVVVTINITHNNDRDLDIFLVDPAGTHAMLLSSDNGGGTNRDYQNTVIRTDATTSITLGSAPFNGTYLPEGSITTAPDRTGAAGGGNYNAVIPANSLNGATIDGNWSLRVFDDRNSNTGRLTGWSLSIIRYVGSGFTTVFNGDPDIGLVNYSGVLNSIATATVTPTTAGTHTYTATTTDSNGCSATSNSVTVNVLESPDAYIAADYCSISGKIQLTALGGAAGATYLWSTGETTKSIVVDQVAIYTVTITNPNGCSDFAQLDVSNELVVNGNFDAGNTGFTSGYGFRPSWTYPALASTAANSSLWDENYYGIGTNGRYYHTNFWGHQDHTTGNGNYMIVNGNVNAGTTIWQEVVNVEPNTNYYFSAWAMSLNSVGNDAVLQFEVNGVLVGTQARLPAGVSNDSNNGWVRFYSDPKWNSGSVSGPITIRIRNVEPAASGNDFGLDDISFGTLDPLPLQIQVAADDVCEGDTLYLHSNAEHGLEPITYSWTGPNGWTSNLANPKIPNATPGQNNGTYHLEATDGYGCAVLPDETTITVNPAPAADAGPDQDVCTANPVVPLNGIIGGSATSATWSSNGGGTFNPDQNTLGATYTLSAAEISAGVAKLVLTTNDPAGACDAVSDTLVVTIHNSLEISLSSVTPLCYNGSDGTATATVTTQSTPPYTFLWSDGQTNATATGLAAGTYSVTATDANGCTATGTVNVTEPDPFIISGDPTFVAPSCYGASDGTATITASGGTEPYTIQWDAAAGSQTTATATNLAAGTYSVFISDSQGCSASVFYVTLPQPPPPTLSCPPDVEDVMADNNCSKQVPAITDPTYSGFCATTISYELTGSTIGTGTGLVNDLFFKVGVTTVTYTISDAAGNTKSCSFKVTLHDITPPSLTAGGCNDVTENAAPNNCSKIPATLSDPTYSDNCWPTDSLTLTWTMTGATTGTGVGSVVGQTFNVGTTKVTYVVSDPDGNKDSCSFNVKIKDVTPPNLTAGGCADVTETTAPNNCSKVPVTITDPTYTDNCWPVDSLTITWKMSGATTGTGTGSAVGQTFNVGTTKVTYIVSDPDGNKDSCSFNVTIRDITPPSLTLGGCTNITEDAAPNNCSKIPATLNDPTYSDNCWAVDSLTLTWTMTGATAGTGVGSVVGQTFNVGTTKVTYVVSDPDGNKDSCSFDVTIKDVTPPNLQIAGCQSVSDVASANNCTKVPATMVDPVYSDACWPTDSLTLTWTMTGATTGSGFGSVKDSTFNVGVTNVTYTVTDPDGNYDNCSFDVTIVHTAIQPANFTCPTSVVNATAAAGTCGADVTLDPLTYTDPCNEIDSVWNNSPFRTSASDASGNYPVGSTSFYWYITDISGNKDSCKVTVIVDDLPPTLTCPPDVVTSADYGKLYNASVTLQDPVYGDNCPNPVLTWTLTPPTGYGTEYNAGELSGTGIYLSPDTFWLGITTIKYKIVDSSGNMDSCEFTVTVQAAPDITCAPDTTIYADAGCTNSFDPGVPVLNSGVPPIDWVWTIHFADGSSSSGTSTGVAPNPAATPIGVVSFPVGTTTIDWSATNVSGQDVCTQTVIVIDTIPPTFTTAPAEFCVEPLTNVNYAGAADNLNYDIDYPTADYYLFKPGDSSLDINMSTYIDNCCTSADSYTIEWVIDFEGTNPSEPSVSGTGQPSTISTDIKLWGDGVTFQTRVHTITYWITDCHGNKSLPVTRNITVKPRPNIIKTN